MVNLNLENEYIEPHPPRNIGDDIVIINKKTGYPEIAKFGLGGAIYIYSQDLGWFKTSPYYWEIAWP